MDPAAPAAVGPASMPATAPAKLPIKMPLPGKMLLPGKIPLPVKMPLPMPPKASAPAGPAPLTAKTAPAATRKVLRPARNSDSDDEAAALLGSGGPRPAAAPRGAGRSALEGKRPRREAPVRRGTSPPPSSSSSSADDTELSGDESERVTLFQLAKQRGLIDITKAEVEEPVEMGAPPRPPVLKFPSDIDAAIKKQEDNVAKRQAQMRIRDDNKAVSLGTSKTNYIDPRIIFAWAKRASVPADKLLSKRLQEKFPWAKEIDDDFRF